MPESNPWKNRQAVRICSLIDMMFAILIISAYIMRLVLENDNLFGGDKTLRGFFRPGEKHGITITLWILAFLINGIQFVIGYLLFSSLKIPLNESDSEIQLRRSRCKYYLIAGNAIFVMMISKFIFYVFFDKGNDSPIKILFLVLCILELFFKAYALYFVKEFFDGLKTAFCPSTVNGKGPRGSGSKNHTPRSSV